ncbi:unnamed protein product [Meganyctiphanes norvegica]|uniref:Uncharacterized protein n=1 Tax=Meganyctiphanes norvegica TaxID=48144 RepID=A0AAV2R0S8_MEGNR
MMKNSNFRLLLFLLPLAIILRTSSAHPIAFAKTTSPAVRAVVEVTRALTEAIQWFQDNINNSPLGEAISKLEEQVDKLPIEITEVHQKMLEGLYRSQARIVGTRTVLEEFAVQLKSQCDGLIAMYSRNDVSRELLSYSVTRFVKLAGHVKMILKDASAKLRETHDELLTSKSILKTYNFKLEIKQQEHYDVHQEKVDSLERVFIIVVIATLGLATPIAYPIIYGKIADLEDVLRELKIKIDKVQDTVSDLVSQNDQISNYVMEEIHLINSWQFKLLQSLSDHQPEITPEDIKFGIEEIKDRLRVLRKACINYLNHKLPDILQSEINNDIHDIDNTKYVTFSIQNNTLVE